MGLWIIVGIAVLGAALVVLGALRRTARLPLSPEGKRVWFRRDPRILPGRGGSNGERWFSGGW